MKIAPAYAGAIVHFFLVFRLILEHGAQLGGHKIADGHAGFLGVRGGLVAAGGTLTAFATLAAAVLAVETLAGFALLTALTARLILFLLGALFARKGRFDGKADALVLAG